MYISTRPVCVSGIQLFYGCRIIKIHKRSLLFSFRADTDAEVMIHRKDKKASAVSDKDIRDAACGACFPCTALVPYLKLILAGFFFAVNSPEAVEDKK